MSRERIQDRAPSGALSLAVLALLTLAPEVRAQQMSQQYLEAARLYRESAAKAPADQRACYLAYANHHECLAARLGPNPPASCPQPACVTGSSTESGSGGGSYTGNSSYGGSVSGSGQSLTPGLSASNPETQQMVSALDQTFSLLSQGSDRKAAERNARQRAELAATSDAREAERIRREQAEDERIAGLREAFIAEMQRKFVPVAFTIHSSEQQAQSTDPMLNAYVTNGIQALDEIDYRKAAARFVEALNFATNRDDIRLAAAATLVLSGDFRQATGLLEQLGRSSDPSFAARGEELLGVLSIRGESFRWELVRNSSIPEDYRAFLRDYPKGPHAAAAQERFTRLRAQSNAAARLEANTYRFNVWHMHRGFFPTNPTGVLTITPNGVKYEETGNLANLEHNFDYQCRELEDADNHLLGEAGSFQLETIHKNHEFIAQEGSAADKKIRELIKSNCNL